MLPWLCHPGASWQEMLLNKIIFSCISENRAFRQGDNGAVVLTPVTTFTTLHFWQSFISFFNVSITLWTILWGHNLCPVNFYIPVSRVMYSMIKEWKKEKCEPNPKLMKSLLEATHLKGSTFWDTFTDWPRGAHDHISIFVSTLHTNSEKIKCLSKLLILEWI